MQQEGMVSLWVGHADSASDLEDYLKVTYTEDGDVIRSPFATDFRIEYYDEDFREAQRYDGPSQSVSGLLRGYSYDSVIIPKFIQLLGDTLPVPVNAIVLLYNFKHEGEVDSAGSGPVTLRFMGVVSME
jgi:hypothetical protein